MSARIRTIVEAKFASEDLPPTAAQQASTRKHARVAYVFPERAGYVSNVKEKKNVTERKGKEREISQISVRRAVAVVDDGDGDILEMDKGNRRKDCLLEETRRQECISGVRPRGTCVAFGVNVGEAESAFVFKLTVKLGEGEVREGAGEEEEGKRPDIFLPKSVAALYDLTIDSIRFGLEFALKFDRFVISSSDQDEGRAHRSLPVRAQ
ncbi:hypothetical protein CPC08DRAFT_726293 [Agrocybe pediades]|nr:hypothetical protein CPC08DRAFT_726293 [Agrocybe pediades]